MKIDRSEIVKYATEINSGLARILRDLADGVDVQTVIDSSPWFADMVRDDFDMEDGELFECDDDVSNVSNVCMCGVDLPQ